MMQSTHEILQQAKAAKPALALANTETKNNALLAMADALIAATDLILQANAIDYAAASDSVSPVMLDRLQLTPARIADMAQGMRTVAAALPDPVGTVQSSITRPNGMVIEKVSAPLGVVAIIYESRPNVTSDAAALALKSGNVCVLRGGKEAWHSANAIVNALHLGLAQVGLPTAAIQLIQDTTRASAQELMTANGYVDVLIPRGGAGLIQACIAHSTVPCIQTGTGICHIYLAEDADTEKALSILENAKASRPSVCNTAEVCLVHQSRAAELLPRIVDALGAQRKAKGLCPVSLRVCAESAAILAQAGIAVATRTSDTTATSQQSISLAGADDFDTEFLDYILAVKIVPDTAAATAHIAAHSTGHSEAIITEDAADAHFFCATVDSAAVYHNCSTRFTDGGEFGLGCEMGISTQKLHARGPMGLCELCSYKYIIHGTGQTR